MTDALRERANRYYTRASILVGTGALLIALMFTPFVDELSDTNLVFHMLGEHSAFTLGPILVGLGFERMVGGLFASRRMTVLARAVTSLYTLAVLLNHRLNRRGMISLPIMIGLLVYWHVPSNFDYASTHPYVHALFHMSLITFGFLFFMSTKVVSRGSMVGFGFLLIPVMMGYGFVLMDYPLYSVYPAYQNIQAGQAMFASMPLVLALLIYQAVRVVRSTLMDKL